MHSVDQHDSLTHSIVAMHCFTHSHGIDSMTIYSIRTHNDYVCITKSISNMPISNISPTELDIWMSTYTHNLSLSPLPLPILVGTGVMAAQLSLIKIAVATESHAQCWLWHYNMLAWSSHCAWLLVESQWYCLWDALTELAIAIIVHVHPHHHCAHRFAQRRLFTWFMHWSDCCSRSLTAKTIHS